MHYHGQTERRYSDQKCSLKISILYQYDRTKYMFGNPRQESLIFSKR